MIVLARALTIFGAAIVFLVLLSFSVTSAGTVFRTLNPETFSESTLESLGGSLEQALQSSWRTLAGILNQAILDRVMVVGFIGAGLALLGLGLWQSVGDWRVWHRLLTLSLMALIIGGLMYAWFGIFSEMDQLRMAMGNIDQTLQTSSSRIRFNELHELSVRILGGVMIVSATLFFVSVFLSPRSRHKKPS